MARTPIRVVIGAALGDEGKGREVDRLVSLASDFPLVVRHNSSAQAGHTVTVGNQRHVFSHFGSGTLRGASTLLCHKFVVNPIVFNQEWERLRTLGITPNVLVANDCVVSTPLDALLNQLTEVSRGEQRHGSCGLGFGETIRRTEHSAKHVLYTGSAEPTSMERVQSYRMYFERQLHDRGIMNFVASDDLEAAKQAVISNTFDWDRWANEYYLFRSRVSIIDELRIGEELQNRNDLIFEGAQGLELHQGHWTFPHVTRCRTGIEDVHELLLKHWIGRDLQPHYCTRSYRTRHGAGLLMDELTAEQMRDAGYDTTDLTNQPNKFQGSLRWAVMYPDEVWNEIRRDVSRVDGRPHVLAPHITMSCCDQAPPREVEYRAKRFKEFPIEGLALGWGPDSADTENTERRTTMGAPAPEEAIQPTQEEAPETETTETEATPEAAEEVAEA